MTVLCSYVEHDDHKVGPDRHVFVVWCDECAELIEVNGKRARRPFQFCTRECSNASQLDGALYWLAMAECFEIYGTLWAAQSPQVKRASIATLEARWGADWRKVIGELSRLGCQAKHGVDNPFQLPEVIAQCNTPSAQKKRYDTMKVNGTFAKETKPERWAREALCEVFGAGNVVHQSNVNGWAIDLYVQSVDTYVQVDGVYWHGLNRPIDVIKASLKRQDLEIYKTYVRDGIQNAYFLNNELRLVRVTDLWVVEHHKQKTLAQELECLCRETANKNKGKEEQYGNRLE